MRGDAVDDLSVVEGGLAYTLIEPTPHKLIVDAGVGYANEQRLIGNTFSTPIVGGGALFTLKISDTSEFSEGGAEHSTFGGRWS